MHTSIREARQNRGMGLQQYAELMGVSRFEAVAIEADDLAGLIEPDLRRKSFAVIEDKTVTIVPVDIEDSLPLWNTGIAGRHENDAVREELLNRVNAGLL